MPIHLRGLLAFLALIICPGCGAPPTTIPAARPPSASAVTDEPAKPPRIPLDPYAKRAKAITERAADVEGNVTAELRAIAELHGASFHKLEYRLKTLASTARKLRKVAKESPDTPLAELQITDSLRYTLLVEDAPAGNYVTKVAKVLEELERNRHEVVKAKNYWPRGDNYSGVNAVLKTPRGLLWELQFHTRASAQVQLETRDMYEELRASSTPLARRRELFEAMARSWAEVPIPEGALREEAFHPRARLKRLPRPE